MGGVPVRDDGRPTGERPGRALRRQESRPCGAAIQGGINRYTVPGILSPEFGILSLEFPGIPEFDAPTKKMQQRDK